MCRGLVHILLGRLRSFRADAGALSVGDPKGKMTGVERERSGMRILFACLCGVAVLAVLVLTGLLATVDLTHPFWQTRASLTGGMVGVMLGGGLLWITGSKPALARTMAWSMSMALAAVLFITWRAAQTFINSADFEAAAGELWFLGYHLVAATLVALVALVVAQKLPAPEQ